jgi:hypothetical protein
MTRVRIVLALAFLLPVTANAWTRAADERIAKKAGTLAPPDLRLLIERFDSDYKQGIERARAEEAAEPHQQRRLRERIERETRGVVTMIKAHEPMHRVVERLGTLSHLIADANNPFRVRSEDPRPAEEDFAGYFERRMTKFPTVFYGLDRNFLLSGYLDKTFARSAKFYPLLQEEYFRHGQRRTSADFDDRSTAFGVASICYSRAVSDVVNLYYFIWREAGGDVRSARVMEKSNLLLHAN